MEDETVNYSALSNEELQAAETSAVESFNAIDRSNVNADAFADATRIAEQVNVIRAEQATRVEMATQLAELDAMLNVTAQAEATETVEEPATEEEPAAEVTEPELVTASTERPRTDVRDVIKDGKRLNAQLSNLPPLANAQRHAPTVPVVPEQRRESVLVASADIPGFTQGGHVASMGELVQAVTARARMLPDRSSYVPIASLQREFAFTLNDKSTKDEIDEVFKRALDPAVLTAAGGWCAPSQISYDFFNIVAEGGMLDLPTVGITRGGLQYPTSPSFGDVASQIWTWNETQDIAAATGTAQSGTKTCYRVTCPSYTNTRLACDGLCLTMGNLMNDAFPELVANQMRLLFAAQAHYTNNRVIGQLVTGSTSVTYNTTTGHGLAAPVLEAVEMQVIDYRIKYRMDDDAVLEAVFPTWILPMFRADLAKRLGLAEFDVSNERIAAWFTQRGVRVQMVQDWQVGTSGLLGQSTASTAWPTTVQFLLYAAGTWIRGNGMRLDLGVIRDSTLNETNDFTAAWMEECYLTAKVGHESRLVTVPICPNGAVQAGITMGCSL